MGRGLSKTGVDIEPVIDILLGPDCRPYFIMKWKIALWKRGFGIFCLKLFEYLET